MCIRDSNSARGLPTVLGWHTAGHGQICIPELTVILASQIKVDLVPVVIKPCPWLTGVSCSGPKRYEVTWQIAVEEI